MENLELVYSLFNEHLFQTAKNNINELKYYFQTNAATMANPLVDCLLDAIRDYNFDSIDYPLFQGILIKTGKSEQESNKIMSEIVRIKRYTKEQIQPAKKFIYDICAEIIIKKARKKFGNSPSDFLDYLKKTDFISVTNESGTLEPQNFNKLDINSILANATNDYIPSKYEFINNTFNPHRGYPKGATYLIVGSPGVGKSLFMMTECLNMALQGRKVTYLVMGDMTEKDLIHRMAAMYVGCSFVDAYTNLYSIYNSLAGIIGDNLSVIVKPAGVVSVDNLIDYCKNHNEQEVIFCDYDSTFNIPGTDASMYEAFGKFYQRLTEITATGKTLFVASQPKIQYYTESYIPLSGVGESSKKIHYADFILTIGREIGNPNHLLTLSIVKNRRGQEGDIISAIRLDNGRFREIPRSIYDSIKQVNVNKHFTDSDIDSMIFQFNQNQSKMQQATKSMNIGPTPFNS